MKKGLFVILCLFLFPILVYSQTGVCPAADKYVEDGLYDVLDISRESSLVNDFAKFFRSEEFEKRIKSSGGGLKFIVPFKGVPIEFGASGQYDENWETWRSTRDDARWRLDYAVLESIYERSATIEAREIWLAAVRECISSRPIGKNVQLEVASTRDEVLVTLTGILETGVADPVITDLTCSESLECASARLTLIGKIAHTNGLTFKLAWRDETDTEGTLAITTTRGSTGSVSIKRKPLAVQELILTYSETNQEWEIVDTKKEFFLIPNTQYSRCRAPLRRDWFCSGPSDRDHSAILHPFIIDAGVGRVVKNMQARCIEGPCPWTSINSHHTSYWEVLPALFTLSGPIRDGGKISEGSGRFAVAILKQWAGPVKWEVTADIEGLQQTIENRMERYTIPDSGEFSIIIPKNARNPLFILTTDGGIITFTPNEEPDIVPIKLVNVESRSDGSQRYTYKHSS